MRVKLRTLMANPNGVFLPSAIVDLPSGEAEELVKGGYAEAVEPPPKKPRKKKGE